MYISDMINSIQSESKLIANNSDRILKFLKVKLTQESNIQTIYDNYYHI